MTEFGEFSGAMDPDTTHVMTVNGQASSEGVSHRLGPDLKSAIDVALYLNRPLLVTGEPGSGKTSLGFAIAQRLRIGRVYLFVTKSTSEARDLFYRYDALGRFREAQAGKAAAAADFVAYQALGAAILDAHKRDHIAHLTIGRNHEWEAPAESCRSLVIIDEIDKAARDFANDILVEIERLQFNIPELPPNKFGGPRVQRTPAFPEDAERPVVIVTSNAERPLPDAFLRRCVYVKVGFPGEEDLRKILDNALQKRLGDRFDPDGSGGARMGDLVARTRQFREAPGVAKPPGLSEVIDAAQILFAPHGPANPWPLIGAAVAKTQDDREIWDALFPEVQAARM